MGRGAGNNVMDQQVVMIKKEKARMKTKQNIHKSQLLWLPKLCPVPFDGLWLEKRKGRFDHLNQQ